jgi:phosphate:Na+ symporter
MGPLAKLCEKVLPVREAKVNYRRLEPLLLDTPDVALQQAAGSLRKMLGKAWRSANCAFKLYDRTDSANLARSASLDEIEREIDERQSDIASYLARLMEKPLAHKQAERIPLLLHCVNDAERIGDHALAVRDIFASLGTDDKSLSTEAKEEFAKILLKLVRQAQGTLSLLAGAGETVLGAALGIRDEIQSATALCEQNHLMRMREKRCASDSGIMYIELLGEIRKVSRHLANIAERAHAATGA